MDERVRVFLGYCILGAAFIGVGVAIIRSKRYQWGIRHGFTLNLRDLLFGVTQEKKDDSEFFWPYVFIGLGIAVILIGVGIAIKDLAVE